MLVLTRSLNEEIRIGDDVVVRVLDVKGDRVRIGVEAPPEVSVHRQEVYLEIERANREAVDVQSTGLAGAREFMRKKKKKANRKLGNQAGSKKDRSKTMSQIQGRSKKAKTTENMEVKNGT